MNEHDRNNLNFLLSLNNDNKAYKKWSQSVTWDDMTYASELLAQYSKELDAQVEELRIEAELEMLKGNYPEIKEILARVSK